MEWIHQTKQRFLRYLLHKKAAELAALSPTVIEQRSESAAIHAFHRARKQSPFYARLLEEQGVDPERIRTISDFQTQVPIVDKKTIYSSDALKLFPNLLRESSGRIWSSSGSSGTCSFGFEPLRQLQAASLGIDFMLDCIYNVTSVRTIVFNCIPNPWPVIPRFSHYTDLGTRTDIAVHLLEKLSGVYDQFIIGGEPLLLKKLLEEARAAGSPLERRRIHLITGGEFVSEHFRQYLLSLLNEGRPATENVDQSANSVLLTLGLAEFGAGVLFEMPAPAALRARIVKLPALRDALIGDRPFCPQIFQHNPFATYVETPQNDRGKRRLVLTSLDPDAALPLIRYDCGDLAERISYNEFIGRAQRVMPDFRPDGLFPFPFVLASGKDAAVAASPTAPETSADEAKELLYSFQGLLPHLTGFFRMTRDKSNAAVRLLVQLGATTEKDDLPPDAVTQFESAATQRGWIVEWIQHRRFPVSMGLRFDKKFEYV